MRAKILIDDALGRWEADEVGLVLVNDFEKYDYYIQLSPRNGIARCFYFRGDEIELLKE